MSQSGKVYLVGAGPGDPELLTLKALRIMKAADVIVYDRLVSDEILELAPQGITKIDVGKQPRSHPVPQEEINRLLIKLAASRRVVVRLKGGDPFLFGRGGEEALALSAAGIQFEAVPGITSAQVTATCLNVPLTHRGIASGVRYVTGHCRGDAELNLDWAGLCDPQTTLVIYMGLANIDQITSKLIAKGRDPETPVMVVSNASRANQSHFVTTLKHAAIDVRQGNIGTPALFVIGAVVRLAANLGSPRDAPQLGWEMAAE